MEGRRGVDGVVAQRVHTGGHAGHRRKLSLRRMSRQFGLLLPLLLAAPTPSASSAATTEPDIAGMWRELEAHCSAGRCTRAKGSRADDSSAALWQDKITDSPTGAATDCKGRMLAYEYGLKLLPSRKPQLESFDALELHTTCGVSRPRASEPLVPDLRVPTGATFHVDHAFGSDSAGGSGGNVDCYCGCGSDTGPCDGERRPM